MYCPDLSPFHYTCPTGLPGTRSIGWLDRSQPMPTGHIEARHLETIRHFAASPVHLTRGIHRCDFCRGSSVADGNGEVWLNVPGGPIYVAPTLLCHYVEVHNYLPPAEFLQVLDGELRGLSEPEIAHMFDGHANKLATNPERADILVPFYEFQLLWPDDFADLGEFRKFVDWHQGPGPSLPTGWLCKRSDGYCLNMECRDPAREFDKIHSRFRHSPSVPYGYRYRLVYLEEPWVEVC